MELYVTNRLAACRDARLVRPVTFLLTIDKYTGEQVACFAACRDARLVRPLRQSRIYASIHFDLTPDSGVLAFFISGYSKSNATQFTCFSFHFDMFVAVFCKD